MQRSIRSIAVSNSPSIVKVKKKIRYQFSCTLHLVAIENQCDMGAREEQVGNCLDCRFVHIGKIFPANERN